MARWSDQTYLGLAVGGAVLALLMVPIMELLQHHAVLPLWLHIPLTFLVLTLMGGGAGAAGIALAEYRSRSINNRQEA